MNQRVFGWQFKRYIFTVPVDELGDASQGHFKVDARASQFRLALFPLSRYSLHLSPPLHRPTLQKFLLFSLDDQLGTHFFWNSQHDASTVSTLVHLFFVFFFFCRTTGSAVQCVYGGRLVSQVISMEQQISNSTTNNFAHLGQPPIVVVCGCPK